MDYKVHVVMLLNRIDYVNFILYYKFITLRAQWAVSGSFGLNLSPKLPEIFRDKINMSWRVFMVFFGVCMHDFRANHVCNF